MGTMRGLSAAKRAKVKNARAAKGIKAAIAAAARKRPCGKPRLSAQLRTDFERYGKYMGTMRGLPARKRAQVKRIRAEKGIRAAIAAARKMAG